MRSNTPLQNALLMLLAAIFFSVIILTAILAMTGSIGKKKAPSVSSSVPSVPVVTAVDSLATFSGFGTMRLSTADEEPVPVVLALSFYYPSDDAAYYEELCSKTGSLRKIISGYFAGHTAAELRSYGESTVKAQLLRLMNAELVLGKIDTLFFSEYLFFE